MNSFLQWMKIFKFKINLGDDKSLEVAQKGAMEVLVVLNSQPNSCRKSIK